MSGIGELRTAYHDRHAAPRGAAGRRKVVGLVGATIPVELVLAAGAFPVAVSDIPSGPTRAADRYLEAHFDEEVRVTLEALLRGSYEWIDLLVLARSTDTYLELFYVLKEITRLGEGRSLPPQHLYDLLHARSDANRAYGLARLRELRSRLVALTGQPITGERLCEAVRSTNVQRVAINKLLEARRDPACGISGVNAMMAIGAGKFMDPMRHAELLEAYVAESKTPLTGRPRVVLSAGVALSNPQVHEAIEAAGAVVIAEDDPWGSRAGGSLIPDSLDDIDEAIFDKYFLDMPSPHLAPASARDQWLRSELEQARPDAMVVYIPRSDLWFGWDYPRLRSLAAAARVSTLLLRDLDPGVVRDFLSEGVRT